MEFTGVYHKTSEQMSYALNEKELIVNLKTGYDVKQVFLHYGDPFETGILGGKEEWTGTRLEMTEKKRLKYQLWWTITLIPPYKRCKYYFELHTQEEIWYYFEDGFLKQEQLQIEGRSQQHFVIPWINPADINRTPEWVNDTVWYQIFPDRFYNGTPEKNTSDIKPWRIGPVRNEERFGGNLEGICKKLPYLKELGINGIYLNPIMEAESNHKYDTTDYTRIDPAFGSKQDFQKLVKEAHKQKIKIMVDAVFNHCGRNFTPWLDVLKNGRESKYADWFMIQDWSLLEKKADTRDGRYYSFAFMDKMPKLNTNNEEVISYFCKVCEDWVKEYEIDGIRFDVGNEVSHLFLKRIREHLHKIKPDLFLLGEIWHNASQWLQGDEYDSVMNYPLMNGIYDFFVDKKMGKEEFEYMINRCYTMYMQQNNNVMFNLLDSHDTERLINRFHNLDIFYQQLAILFTMPGSPCIYYGTEIALEGAHDPDCRRCMPWEELNKKENQERIENIQTLISMRRTEDACRSLDFHFSNHYKQQRCVEYRKLDGKKEEIEVILNCSEEEIEICKGGKVLFARNFENGVLKKDGTLIRKKERKE